MMMWNINRIHSCPMFDVLNSVCLSAFAEPFTYHSETAPVLLQAVFDDKPQTEHLQGASYGNKRFSLQLEQSTVEANAIQIMQTVTVRGVDYQIIDMDSDISGMATLGLRRFA